MSVARNITTILIIHEKSPSVTMFTGRNNIFKNGRTNIERIVKTTAEITSTVVLEKDTCGNARERIKRPMHVKMIVLIIVFIFS